MTSPNRPARAAPRGRRAAAWLLAGAAAAVAGCSSVPKSASPIEWYRDLTGLSRNDPTGDERNAQNLAAGAALPYPNLASVPPPPDRALSQTERAALEQSLVADRESARARNEALPVPTATPPAVAQPGPPAAVASTGRAPAAASQPAAPAAPPQPPAAAPAASAPPPASAAAPALAPAAPRLAETPPAALEAAPAPPPAAGARVPARRAGRQEPEEPPQESPLVSPTMHSEPEGLAPRAAPPPPALTPSPVPPPSRTAVARAGSPPPPPPLAAPPPVAAAPPPPPAPGLAPTEAPSRPAAATAALVPRGKDAAGTARHVADIAFTEGSNAVPPGQRRALEEVARQQQEKRAQVRIIGYAERGGGDAARQELLSYGQALDRAKAVAAALGELGVPEKQIQVEASAEPRGGDRTPRAEVYLQY